MGNSVNLSPLTITTSHDDTFPSQNAHQPVPQPIALKFPFYLIKPMAGIPTAYRFEDQQANNLKQMQVLYKCSLSGFSNLIFEKMSHRGDARLWRQIEDGQNTRIQEGDQIKIGKFQCKLKYLINDHIPIVNLMGKQQESNILSTQSRQKDNRKKCRICFESKCTQNSPLINLCKCEGSVKYIHFLCLRKWIGQKIKISQEPNCTIYQYCDLMCQLCKSQLPTHFWEDNTFYSLIQQENISPPYAIFEARTGAVSMRGSKIEMYRVKLNQGLKISAGRSGESDIPIKCSTVSRNHFLLYYTHKQLFIKDLKSKYGTFLYSRNAQFSFNIQNGLVLNLNRTLIKICKQKQPFLSLKCCKGFENVNVRIVDDNDDKFTLETWDILDFLE